MKQFTILCLFISSLSHSQTLNPHLQPFLENIVSQFPNVRDIAISPNEDTILFTAQSVMGNLSSIISITKEGQNWSKPQVASFSGKYFDLEPFFSHDGLKLYYVSNRPLSDTTETLKDFDIWYVERLTLKDTWSDPINLGAIINTEHGEFYPSIAKNGNLYFTRDNPELKQHDDIYISEFIDGNFTEPKVLPDAINTEGYEYNAFIAPDESYLIFGAYNRSDGFGSGDLYISYKKDNQWTTAKNLGESINSDKMDYCPFVDSKTMTLYLTSKVDHTKTSIENPLDINGLLKEFYKYENGSSRLYKISISSLLTE